MDFDFSDDQQQLRDAVQRWVSKDYAFERRRSIEKSGGFSRAVWGELADLGLTALAVPEAHGGLGWGAVEAMVVLEELGRGLVLEPYAQGALMAPAVLAHAPEAVQAAWLPRIASGEALVVLAQQERAARYRLDVVHTTAAQTATGWALTGTKSLVPAGDLADAWLVSACTDDGIGLFLVERGAAGATARGYATQDGGRAAEVHLSASPATLLVAPGAGLAVVEQAVDAGIAALAAEGVGAMEALLALTADYLNTRQQFGGPIARFQALRHRVADGKMQLELARSMSYLATLRQGDSAVVRRRAVALAKVQLGRSLRFVGQECIQLHGGIGVTDEYIASHYFKRLTCMELTFGDTLHHLAIVSEGMQDTAGVFA